MIKQIVTVTRNRVSVRAIMTPDDTSNDVPAHDVLEAFALGAVEQHFPNVDTGMWIGKYTLRTPPRRYPDSWGMVCLEIRSR